MLSVIFVSLNKFADWGFSSRFFLILASTAFVAVPAFGGALKTLYGKFVLIAIVFCWLGDFAGPYHFLVGAGFFLIGHLFLIVSYAIHGVEKKRLAFAAPVALAVSGFIAYHIVPNVCVPDFSAHERWFVISYITVITVMAILACSAKGRTTFALLLVGAVTFYISDVFLALKPLYDGERELHVFRIPALLRGVRFVWIERIRRPLGEERGKPFHRFIYIR